ncbi:TPA: type I restriction-modification system subunit M N-terminal domain-containing protein, partial [Streptococcus agalactiae]
MAEKITSLRQALWNSADQLRGQMDANDYKNYLLGLIFYKHLSDKLLLAVCDNLEEHFNTFTDTQKIFEDAYQDEDLKDDLISVVTGDLGYFIEPTLTFEKLIQDVYHNTFQLESLAQGFRDIEQSGEDFENLFKDIDLYSKKLGSTPQKQNQTIANVMKTLNEIDFESVDGDTLGDAYEYLIGEFASESGKKAGEFYTPQAVSHLMTQIVFSGREDQKGMTLYDPAMESGTLLLNAKKYS